MQIEFDWSQEFLDYRQEKGLPPEDDLASRAALTLRLMGLMGEYNRLTQEEQHDEAGRLLRWMVLPTHFVLTDPDTGRMFECIQSEDGQRVRVVSGYDYEEPDLEPRRMPEAPDTE